MGVELLGVSFVELAARELSLEGPLTQGGLVIGRGDAGIAVTVDGRAVRVSPEGLFLVGFGRDAPPTVEVRVRYPDGVTTVRVLHVARRTYQVQRIDGLPSRKVTPAPEDLERIRLDGAAIAAVRARDSSRADFASRFVWDLAAQDPIPRIAERRASAPGAPAGERPRTRWEVPPAPARRLRGFGRAGATRSCATRN